MPTIRITQAQKEWLDEKKLAYFNNEHVPYREVVRKIRTEIDEPEQ